MMYRIEVHHWGKWQDSGDGRYATIEEAKEASLASEFEQYYHWRIVDDSGVEYYSTIDQIRPPDVAPVLGTPPAADVAPETCPRCDIKWTAVGTCPNCGMVKDSEHYEWWAKNWNADAAPEAELAPAPGPDLYATEKLCAKLYAHLNDALDALDAVDDAFDTTDHIQQDQALEMVVSVLQRSEHLRARALPTRANGRRSGGCGCAIRSKMMSDWITAYPSAYIASADNAVFSIGISIKHWTLGIAWMRHAHIRLNLIWWAVFVRLPKLRGDDA